MDPLSRSQTEAPDRSLGKRWLLLMPIIFVTYSLAYLDRANFGFGAAAGLASTLGITGSQSALLSSLFFLGYFVFQIPGAAYARRRSATRLIFFALIGWGSLAALTGVLHNFWLLAADRFLLGVAESIIFPAMLLLNTRWFTRRERSRANTVFILGNPITVLWMSAITGYLIHSFGWQKTFILEGIPSVLWSVVWIALVRDRPEQVRWMTTTSAAALGADLEREQIGIASVASVRSAMFRPDVLLLSLQYFFWSAGIYGFVLWLPTIIRQGANIGIEATGLLSSAPYLLAILLMLLNSFLSDRTLRRRSLVWPFLVLSGLSLLGSFAFTQHSFWLAYGCLILGGACMYAPYGPFFAIIPEAVPASVTAEVLGFINGAGALGGFAGTWLVGLLQARTGNSRAGFLLMAVSMILSGALMIRRRPSRPQTLPGTASEARSAPLSSPQAIPNRAV